MDDTGTDQESQDSSDSADEAESPHAGESSSDGATDESGSSDDSGSPAGDPDDDGARLDELGDRIQSVRSEAEESVAGVAEPEGEFHESGSEQSAEADDQTAAPPG